MSAALAGRAQVASADSPPCPAGDDACAALVAPLGDMSATLGTFDPTIPPPASGWPTHTIGRMSEESLAALVDLAARVGSCPDAGACLDDAPSVATWLRRSANALGTWPATGDVDPHTVLGLLDRDGTLLAGVRDRLDTLVSNTTPASTTTPSATVSLSADDRTLATANDAELASVLWVLIGALSSLLPTYFLMRELL